MTVILPCATMTCLSEARRAAIEGVAVGSLDLIGNTPLVRLRRVVEEGCAHVFAKLESLNPSGSVKDRIALAMVEAAEAEGSLRAGGTIVVATSGNSGISLAMVAAAKAYALVIFMPEHVAADRRRLLARYGAEIRLTPAYMGMGGSNQEATDFVGSRQDCILTDPFRNPCVVQVHRETTAQEIIQATGGKVDAFVAGVGTGGTLTGVGERLKEENPSVMVVAVEPSTSRVLAGGAAMGHGISGIGADFPPPLLNREIIDDIISVSTEDATKMSSRLARQEGLLVGISSGANVVASLGIARRLGEGKTVLTVLPDTGERYLAFSA